MKTLIEILQQHRTDRSLKSEPISQKMLDNIIEAAYRAPTSLNSQQVSLVVETDPERRAQIAEIAGGQPWIAQAPVFITVVLDLYKTDIALKKESCQQVTSETIEGLVSGCTDVGIVLGTLIAAAHAQGLGIVPIGGIRANPQAMMTLLKLPHFTFPVVGIAIGHIDQPAVQKPRLPLATFCHYGEYRAEGLETAIESYNETLLAHWQSTQRSDGLSWSANTAQYYQMNYFPNVLPSLLRQGFKFEK